MPYGLDHTSQANSVFDFLYVRRPVRTLTIFGEYLIVRTLYAACCTHTTVVRVVCFVHTVLVRITPGPNLGDCDL